MDFAAQVIVVAGLSERAPDAQQLAPALQQLSEPRRDRRAKLPDGATLSADGDYFSEENASITAEHGLHPYIATGHFTASALDARTDLKECHHEAGDGTQAQTKKGVESISGASRSSSRCLGRSAPSKMANKS